MCAHSRGQVGTAGHVIEISGLKVFLVCLSVIEVIEVRDNDGHRQSDGQYAGDSAETAHDFAPNADRTHIAVTNGRLLF